MLHFNTLATLGLKDKKTPIKNPLLEWKILGGRKMHNGIPAPVLHNRSGCSSSGFYVIMLDIFNKKWRDLTKLISIYILKTIHIICKIVGIVSCSSIKIFIFLSSSYSSSSSSYSCNKALNYTDGFDFKLIGYVDTKSENTI